MSNHIQILNKNFKIKLILNSNFNITEQISFSKSIKYYELCQKIIKALKIKKVEQIKLFTISGIELFDDDVQYIQENDEIYISLGEEFNQFAVIHEYEILKQLGEGGFGSVHLGQHKKTGKTVAIKFIKNDMSTGNVTDIEMIFAEARLLKALNHKNIVQVFETYTFKNMQAVFVMEYLEGGELAQYLKQNEKCCLDEKETQFFMRQIVDAIYYCHKEQLIHRDLKLQNILLENKLDKKIKVVDFGIAGICCPISEDITEAGSIKYIAPEVLLYKTPANPALDIWALGVILYQLLHGYCPFEGNSSRAVGELVKKGEYKISPRIEKSVSRCCIELINQMLQLNPKKRISTVDLSNHKWITGEIDQILADEAQQKLLEKDSCKEKKEETLSAKKKSSTPTQQKSNFTYLNKLPSNQHIYKPNDNKKVSEFQMDQIVKKKYS